jgi:integrase
MRRSLSDNGVRALKPRAARYLHPDPELGGHGVRVMPSGVKSFVVVANDPDGKQHWITLGRCDAMPIEEARGEARAVIKRIRAGLPAREPTAPAPESFAAVAQRWSERVVKDFRRARETRRIIATHLVPALGERPFEAIRRSEVVALLDAVEDGHGTRTADTVLTTLRGLMNWHAKRVDGYTPPLARGMGRQSTAAAARKRILDDDEIRRLWQAADAAGTYGALVQFALLTAQRRDKLAAIRWDDVAGGIWTIRSEPREKGHGGPLPLPPTALAIIERQPRMGSSPYIFAAAYSGGPFGDFSANKRKLDRAAGISEPWVFHDLRRTARSLMSRAGVEFLLAERILGHSVKGVAAIYDRHDYRDEKANALHRLANTVIGIVEPQPTVVPLRGKIV